jgi:hypothetical protein
VFSWHHRIPYAAVEEEGLQARSDTPHKTSTNDVGLLPRASMNESCSFGSKSNFDRIDRMHIQCSSQHGCIRRAVQACLSENNQNLSNLKYCLILFNEPQLHLSMHCCEPHGAPAAA